MKQAADQLNAVPLAHAAGAPRRALWMAPWLVLVCLIGGCGGHDEPAADDDDAASNQVSTTDADTTARYTAPAADTTRLRAGRSTQRRAEPAPRPTEPLPADASCVTAECHADMMHQPVVHAPVSAAACETCHAPDTGGHVYPVKRSGNDLCTFCHSVAGELEHQHAAVSGDGCLACHQPHAGENEHLLVRGTDEALCGQCHDLPRRRFVHEPFATGECTLCHEPHEASAPKLLRGGAGPEHCATCHEDIQTRLQQAGTSHPPARDGCIQCHQPHSADHAYQLKDSVRETCLDCHTETQEALQQAEVAHGPINSEESCAHCHDAHGSSHEALQRARTDRLCLDCHDDPVARQDGRMVSAMGSVLERAYLHGPVRTGECAACHQSHGGAHAQLLTEPYSDQFYSPFDPDKYALCFRCHDSELVQRERTTTLTRFRDGDRNLHYAHVHRDPKGRTCRTCHAVHASEQPRHIAASVPFEGSSWAMPIGYEAREDGGSCAPGCHEPKTYQRNQAPDDINAQANTTEG